MLIQVLNNIKKRFNIKFRLFLVYESVPGLHTNMEQLRQWAIKDANFIADQYQLKKVSQYPTAKALVTGQQTWQLEMKNVESALQIFQHTWEGSFTEHYKPSTPVITFQINNQKRLMNKGHYSPASIFFCGDWFVGIDRLRHFEACLTDLNLQYTDETSFFNKNTLLFPSEYSVKAKEDVPIEAFISIRSPYSYVGLLKSQKIAKYYGVSIKIKLIIPMSMRGIHVAPNKLRYMYVDAYREASIHGIPLHSFTLPNESAVKKCHQLFAYADQKGKGVAFIERIFEAIYVDAIDISQTSFLKNLFDKLEISYDAACDFAQEFDWQNDARANLVDIESMNFWEVPCFRYMDTYCWGQDRLAQIEQAIISQ